MSELRPTRKQGATRVPANVIAAIESILDYLWSDELRDFQCRTKEDERKKHIFQDLNFVRRFLQRQVK